MGAYCFAGGLVAGRFGGGAILLLRLLGAGGQLRQAVGGTTFLLGGVSRRGDGGDARLSCGASVVRR